MIVDIARLGVTVVSSLTRAARRGLRCGVIVISSHAHWHKSFAAAAAAPCNFKLIGYLNLNHAPFKLS